MVELCEADVICALLRQESYRYLYTQTGNDAQRSSQRPFWLVFRESLTCERTRKFRMANDCIIDTYVHMYVHTSCVYAYICMKSGCHAYICIYECVIGIDQELYVCTYIGMISKVAGTLPYIHTVHIYICP